MLCPLDDVVVSSFLEVFLCAAAWRCCILCFACKRLILLVHMDLPWSLDGLLLAALWSWFLWGLAMLYLSFCEWLLLIHMNIGFIYINYLVLSSIYRYWWCILFIYFIGFCFLFSYSLLFYIFILFSFVVFLCISSFIDSILFCFSLLVVLFLVVFWLFIIFSFTAIPLLFFAFLSWFVFSINFPFFFYLFILMSFVPFGVLFFGLSSITYYLLSFISSNFMFLFLRSVSALGRCCCFVTLEGCCLQWFGDAVIWRCCYLSHPASDLLQHKSALVFIVLFSCYFSSFLVLCMNLIYSILLIY